ncbi:ParB family protein [Halorhodospira halophila]|uniref:ParB family protein n=1 Tax=Halorhodospira halophila TaxID=1053 RepID=UPI001911AD82|nr:ParB family protein [Halorhodospira halophila]MBK5944816.1 hypothetical protein [Halorhodospira halophila]
MTKRGLTEKVRQGLWQGHYGNREQPLDEPGDPVTITQMVLSIDQITEYEDNPRKLENPHYEEIKASIAAQRGLSNSLEVTRRPGDDRYIICSGGNTRLRILRELYNETGDEAFAQVHCLYRPWQGETTILANHLVENDLRGELALIDKARALQHIRARLEHDHGEPLSRNALIKRLHELGYTISKRQLLRHEYAAESLLPAMPEALAKIGGETVDKLRQLHRSAETVWQHHGREAPDLGPLWEQALAHTDGPDWTIQAARTQLVTDLAEALGTEAQRIDTQLDAALNGRPLADETCKPGPASAGYPVADDAASANNHAGDTLDDSYDPAGVNTTLPPGRAESNEQEGPRAQVGTYTSIPEYREQIYRLARGIAQRHQIDCHVFSWDRGLGYLVDLPHHEELTPPTTRWVWWTLLALSEAPSHVSQLPGDYQLGHALERDPETLRRHEPPATELATDFISHPSTTDVDFHDVMQLIQLCRQLRQADAERDITLWEG